MPRNASSFFALGASFVDSWNEEQILPNVSPIARVKFLFARDMQVMKLGLIRKSNAH